MNEYSILIVEDEAIVAFDLAGIVEQFGYNVIECVSTFDDAVSCVQKKRPDLVLMDINLDASYDGIDVAAFLLEKYNIPVLYITAFSDEATIDRAAQTYPVGYILKPFCNNEIKANLQLAQYQLKRRKSYVAHEALLELANGYFFDRTKEQLYYQNQPISLGNNEIQLLLLLIDANGQTVTFEMIENHIYSGEPISPSTIRTLIYRLRIKLNGQAIETISGLGCKINLGKNLVTE